MGDIAVMSQCYDRSVFGHVDDEPLASEPVIHKVSFTDTQFFAFLLGYTTLHGS